ncbi:MAG: 4-alpha-glucanotransferase [Candidatus Gastranaerophilales bacterium]|nr:4-alpha-glucanotransferase [Candidatus Gastranaerophilales bacterium]
MRISALSYVSFNPSFERKLTPQEKPQYTEALNSALEYLDIKNLAMIIHGTSFPAVGNDADVGSPYGQGANKFVDFLQLHGFNAIQLGPGGEISKQDPSPYSGKVFAKNGLFIDLNELTKKEYAQILSPTIINKAVKKAKSSPSGKNYSYTNFDKAFNTYEKVMTAAYSEFVKKVKSKDKKALQLNQQFEAFKQNESSWLEYDGVYKALSSLYKTDNFNYWGNEEDKNLITELKNGNPDAIERYNIVKSFYREKIELNNFIQFVADKQLKENSNHRKEIGFNYIGDILVGFSHSDVWANKDAFLEGWELGCPYGGKGNGPQTWAIPTLDPKKLFDEDGGLGIAGQLLEDKIAYSLKNYNNVRVDHALGLADPYIYKPGSIVSNDGVIDRKKLVANNVSNLPEVDPQGNFRKVLEKIVLPAFKKYGADKDEAVWEALCSPTPVFSDTYYNKLKLPEITQTEWSRVEGRSRMNWSLLGSHDSAPAIRMNRDNDGWNIDYLSGYLNPDPANSEGKNNFRAKIANNPLEQIKAKFTELFRGTKNIQISFADFFGIDKVYNHGGQKKPSNWRLRLNNNFEDTYHKMLEAENPKNLTLNMPEILATAVRAKKQMEVAMHPDMANNLRDKLNNETKPLLDTLDRFAKVLKEKSN